MTDRIPFFDFFDRFVPPRELRLMLHDAAVTGGVLNRAERTMELEVETAKRCRTRRWRPCGSC